MKPDAKSKHKRLKELEAQMKDGTMPVRTSPPYTGGKYLTTPMSDEEEKELLAWVRKVGRSATRRALKVLVAGLRHICDKTNHDCMAYRKQCSTELLDRFGAPKLKASINRLEVDVPLPRLYDFTDPFSSIADKRSRKTRSTSQNVHSEEGQKVVDAKLVDDNELQS